jgi:hypothetical protein
MLALRLQSGFGAMDFIASFNISLNASISSPLIAFFITSIIKKKRRL